MLSPVFVEELAMVLVLILQLYGIFDFRICIIELSTDFKVEVESRKEVFDLFDLVQLDRNHYLESKKIIQAFLCRHVVQIRTKDGLLT